MLINQNAELAFKRLFDDFNKQFNSASDDELYAKWRIAEVVGRLIGSRVSLLGVVANEESLSAPLDITRRFIDELNEIFTVRIDEAYNEAKALVKRRHSCFFQGVNSYTPDGNYPNSSAIQNPFTCMSLDYFNKFITDFDKLLVSCGLTIIDHTETLRAEASDRQAQTNFTPRAPVQNVKRGE